MSLGECGLWGTENRNNPVRAVSSGHCEFRCIDSTSSIYLVTVAYIAAGLLGKKKYTMLVLGDCRMHTGKLDEKMMKELRIETLLPKSLDKAIDVLEASFRGLDEILSKEILTFYLVNKKQECDYHATMTEAEVRSAYFRDH